MKTAISFLFILVFVFSALAQTEKKTILWSENDPRFGSMMKDGELFKGYGDTKFQYVAQLAETDDYYILWVNVINKSEGRFIVQPSDFRILVTAPFSLTIEPLDSKELAEKIKNKGKWKSALNRAGAGMAQKQSTAVITDNNGNKVNVEVNERDDAAIENTNRRIEQREANNQARGDTIAKSALLGNTLFSGQNNLGYVYFPKKKDSTNVTVEFTLDGVSYDIPFTTGKITKSK